METIDKIFKKAIKLYELKRYGLAKKELFKLLEVAPDFPPALWLLATCFYSEENYKKGITYLNIALQSASNESQTHYLLGLGHQGLGNLERALESAERAIEINPQQAEYFLLVAQLYFEMKIYGNSKKFIHKTLELDPYNVQALQLKSHIESLFKRQIQAEKDINTALKINPENIGLHLEKADQEFGLGNYQQAIYHYTIAFKKTLAIGP